MLNYLWAGMIVVSILSALGYDLADEINNKYQNGAHHRFSYKLSNIDNQAGFNTGYAMHYFSLDASAKKEIIIPVTNNLPELWKVIANKQSSKIKTELRVKVIEVNREQKEVALQLPEVHWIKIRAVSNALFEMASFAVKLAIGLAGIMALWLGLMRIAEKSGLISYFVRLIYPMLHWLFPSIDRDHPVLGSISLNMTANILGLGNAATPMGIKAMQQLQELNKTKDTASDEMCMFLAINTSSVQLLPPVTLIAVMGLGVSELIVPIILATTASTIAAITSAKLFARARNR